MLSEVQNNALIISYMRLHHITKMCFKMGKSVRKISTAVILCLISLGATAQETLYTRVISEQGAGKERSDAVTPKRESREVPIGGAAAQGILITGVIQDQKGVPIVGATVCQVATTNCTAADRNGIFHLLPEEGKEMNLQVSCLGFNPVEVVITESTSFPLNITLTPMYIPGEIFGEESYADRDNSPIVRSSLSLEAIFSDFAEFSTILGNYNTDVMDYFSAAGPEFGASISRVYFGFGLGMGYSYKDDHDTLSINLNNTAYKINLGFDLVNTGRIRITPLVSVRWLRYRLQNYAGDRKISLASYLEERDLDLRFNQTTAVAGLNIEYLIYSKTYIKSDYWSVGLFGGYATKLNRKPWVYSRGNRIITDEKINLKPLTFGISISYYTFTK